MRPNWAFKPNGKGGGNSVMRLSAGSLRIGSQAKVSDNALLARDTAAKRGWAKLEWMASQVPPVTHHAIVKFRDTVPGAASLPDGEIEVMIKALYLAASPYTLSRSMRISNQKKYGNQDNIGHRRYRVFEITHSSNAILAIRFDDNWQRQVKQARELLEGDV